MREVAERAGVAMSSVSRVISDHPDVSATMRDRVLRAVTELGYEPDLLARSLRNGSTRTIGFVVGDISNPLLSEIALGAETALRAGGYAMLLVNSENLPELDAQHIRLFRQRRVDGLLLSLADERAPAALAELRHADVPAVLIDRDLTADVGQSAAVVDHALGVAAAVEHLHGLGHRRVGMVTGPGGVRAARVRASALEDACGRLGVEAVVEAGAFSAAFGEEATRRLLDRRPPPTALVAGGNQILAGMLREVRARRLVVPRDLSLVTCDAVPLTELLDPPLATIDRDNRGLGRQAAVLLLERMAGAPPRRVALPTTFVPAGSCGPAPA